jgi:hypothetical protein
MGVLLGVLRVDGAELTAYKHTVQKGVIWMRYTLRIYRLSANHISY